jgi:hypothetical protein
MKKTIATKSDKALERRGILKNEEDDLPGALRTLANRIFGKETGDALEKEEIKSYPYWLTILSFLGVTVPLVILAYLLKLYSPPVADFIKHSLERIELIIVLALGLVAIFFAIRAKVEAAAALREAQKIYIAIPSFFNNYAQVTDRIEELINEAENELLILVSLPAYGHIVSEDLGRKFYAAITKRITDSITQRLNIQFICFSSNICEKFERKFKEEHPNSFVEYEEYKKRILEGIHSIKTIKKQDDPSYENFWTLSADTHVRLFIADSKRAIFATVPNFTPEDPRETDIAGFETTEGKMVEILEKLFREQKLSGDSVSEPDFRKFFDKP